MTWSNVAKTILTIGYVMLLRLICIMAVRMQSYGMATVAADMAD